MSFRKRFSKRRGFKSGRRKGGRRRSRRLPTYKGARGGIRL